MTTLQEQADDLCDTVYSTPIESGNVQNLLCEMSQLLRTMASEIEKAKRDAWKAGNAASCLANGIRPD